MAEDEKLKPVDDSDAGSAGMSEAEIDRNLVGSFPASDPPSWTLGIDQDTGPPAADSDKHERDSDS